MAAQFQSTEVSRFLSSETFELLLSSTSKIHRDKICAAEEINEKHYLHDAIASLNNCTIEHQANRYLKYEVIESGITFVKSPKGSGKTTAVNRALLNYFSINKRPNKKISEVLLIGHRKALITANCHKLGLNCYLDYIDEPPSDLDLSRYGICLDSLTKIGDRKYEVIIIDEVEQVLAHFLSKTMERDATKVFRQFQSLVASAKRVVVLDADISWLTFTVLTKINRNQARRKELNFIFNESLVASRKIHIHNSKEQLIGLLSKKVHENKKIFFASNSKTQVDKLALALDQKSQDESIKILKVTSDNSTNPKIQKIIKDISEEISGFDLVLASPSMGTGIDISFPDDGQHVDCVFGIFNNNVTTHTEIDQQLQRVRNPKEIHVWISPSVHNYSTDFNSARVECLAKQLEYVMLPTEAILAGENLFEVVGDFVSLGTLVTAQRRSSFNNLKYNFIDLKQRQGYQIITVTSDDNEKALGKTLDKIGKQLSDEEYIAKIKAAVDLNRDEFDRYVERLKQNNSDVPDSIRYSVKKFWIKIFFPESPLSDELILASKNDQLRKSVIRYEKITDKNFMAKNKRIINAVLESSGREQLAYKEIWNADVLLLHYIFSQTPIYLDCVFDPSAEFTSDDLESFARQILKLKKEVEGQLRVEVRNDILKKPTSQLKTFLRLVGLDFKIIRTSASGGVKKRYYTLDDASLTQMQSYVERRQRSRLAQSHPEEL